MPLVHKIPCNIGILTTVNYKTKSYEHMDQQRAPKLSTVSPTSPYALPSAPYKYIITRVKRVNAGPPPVRCKWADALCELTTCGADFPAESDTVAGEGRGKGARDALTGGQKPIIFGGGILKWA